MGLIVAACGQPTTSPSESPFGDGGAPADLADVPQPGLATIDLGSGSPGYDGTGSFYSYDSDLSPDATIDAYANQLLRAGFHEADRSGVWRVFVGPRLTVWVRVGSGGPPTSLVVRVQPTIVVVADGSDPRPSAAPRSGATGDNASQSSAGGPKPTAKPVSQQRRPDPPHGTGGALATGSGSGGGTLAGGTASGGSTGTGTGSPGGTPIGTSSGGNVAGGAGTGSGGGDFTRP